ncbi:hypothetical protein [Bacillus sp. RAR_GA_16]|uniref:hypothetical protein n=1 Tax=Bacillus sp. RAR_GA_16 TaxID=2876774 RepID=UPI001CCD7959|nr:hypothetical protein [Bacillus sp. RAR_GA_16]MCA0174477.1 hypothetical protein [Bacillus sp. RAR_GA_16]
MYGRVIVLQVLIWFAYYMVIHFSPHDHVDYKVVLFLVFLYLNWTVSFQLFKRGKELFILLMITTTGTFIMDILIIVIG